MKCFSVLLTKVSTSANPTVTVLIDEVTAGAVTCTCVGNGEYTLDVANAVFDPTTNTMSTQPRTDAQYMDVKAKVNTTRQVLVNIWSNVAAVMPLVGSVYVTIITP